MSIKFLLIALLCATGLSYGEDHEEGAKGARAEEPLKDCRTCAYYEGYDMLWHQGKLLPKSYADAHREKGTESDFGHSIWVSMKCGDTDRSSYCEKFKDDKTCGGDSWCYWEKDTKPKCELNTAYQAKFGSKCNGDFCTGSGKSYADIAEIRSKCQKIETEKACSSSKECEWDKKLTPCLPKGEVMTCSRANKKTGIDKEACCEALNGCDWDGKSKSCGPWKPTKNSCDRWLSEDKNALKASFSNFNFPAKTLVSKEEYYKNWDSHVKDKVPSYSTNMENKCRTVKHLFDGHGRSYWSAIDDAYHLLETQKDVEDVHVEHWGCSTFSRTNEASDFQKESRTLGSRMIASALVGFNGGFSPASLATLGSNVEKYLEHDKTDPRNYFQRWIGPLWKKHKARGKSVNVTVQANQLTAQACGTVNESRDSNSPFSIGIRDGKFVQWPARCAKSVRCNKKEDETKQFVCRLPEAAKWEDRMKEPEFSDAKSLEKERVVVQGCAYDEKTKKGEWVTVREIPNFKFILGEVK